MLYCECKVTNFESNSQPASFAVRMSRCCIASAKLQILKAIHNNVAAGKQRSGLYCECKVTNFESNSQLIVVYYYIRICCIASAKLQILKAIHNRCWCPFHLNLLYCECKVTNFESNSQQWIGHNPAMTVVLRVQSYKF